MTGPSAVTLIIALLVAGGCTNAGADRNQTPATARPAILVAAGDIAACDSLGDEATAALVEEVVAVHPDAVVALLGDTVYEVGSPQEFASCYEPSWGQYRAITKPAPGNHDYTTRGGSGYHGYFGVSAGEPRRGWYSYDVGSWTSSSSTPTARSSVVKRTRINTAVAGGPRLARWSLYP